MFVWQVNCYEPDNRDEKVLMKDEGKSFHDHQVMKKSLTQKSDLLMFNKIVYKKAQFPGIPL